MSQIFKQNNYKSWISDEQWSMRTYVRGISSDITIIAACNIQNTYERATYDITFKSYLMMKIDNRSPT